MAIIIASSSGGATPEVNPPPVPKKVTKRFLEFKRGDTLYGILSRHGFASHHVGLILKQNLLPKGLSLSNGEAYRLRLSGDKKFAEIKIYDAPKDISYVFWRNGEAAGSLLRQESFGVKERTVWGEVRGSILNAILQKLPSQWIAHRFMDAYTFDYNLPKRLQRGAKFKIRLETKWDGTDLVGYGEILETAIELGSAVERRFYIRYPGGGTFVDPGNSYADRPLFAPVSYLRVSSLFESRRFHPIKHRKQPHLGVDFELPEGTDIFAAESGRVLRSGFQRASGNFVVIQHKNGIESYYNHMLRIASGIYPGAPIANGQKLGEIGCTGYCTKGHLHFAIKKMGRFVDPLRYIKNFPYRSQKLISLNNEDL